MRKSLLLASASALLLSFAAAPVLAADAPEDAGAEVKEVVVIGKRVIKGSAGATGLDLSLRETPQSVTVVTAAQIRDFALTDANQLLSTVPGINVEADETDRTYYNSRGFDILNFQVDGVGQPLDWGLQVGSLDTALFERIEAIRGATGMLTGTGNPSAVINYIRKRPTKAFQGSVTGSYGSWDNKRLTADVSGPLNADGTVSGRFVYAKTDTDSYLDYYGVDRNVYYGILSWDITPKLKATAGYSQQDNLADGVTWGALPLNYTDGTPIHYDVSASSAAPWTYWNTHDHQSFGELSYAFDNGWTVKGIFTHKAYDEDAKLMYPWGNPDPVTGLDPNSNNGAGDLGVLGYTALYPSTLKQDMLDIIANGNVTLFGREHQVVFGINATSGKTKKWEGESSNTYYAPMHGGSIAAPAEPTTYYPLVLEEQIKTDVTRAYGAIHLNLTDKLTGIVGFNAVDLKGSGTSYGVDQTRSESKVSPYVGVVYDVNANVSLYASYADIFNPQSESDVNRNRLEAAQGKNFEAGIKSEWFDNRLYATAAYFKSEQYGLADWAGYYPGTFDAYYTGLDTFVKGYELEVAGKITPNWTVNGGWTDLSVEGEDGSDVRTYLPRRTLKLSTTYGLPQYRDLKLGAAVRWQSEVSTTSAGFPYSQDAYSVLDLSGSFRVTDKMRASLNVKNATDEKYFGGLQWDQAFYAAPRSVIVSLDYSF